MTFAYQLTDVFFRQIRTDWNQRYHTEECQSIKCLILQRQSQAGPIRVEILNLFISFWNGKRHNLKTFRSNAGLLYPLGYLKCWLCLNSWDVLTFVHLSIKVVWRKRINYWQCNELQLQLFQAFRFQCGLITWIKRSSVYFFLNTTWIGFFFTLKQSPSTYT